VSDKIGILIVLILEILGTCNHTMTKKVINQNTKLNQELINTIEPKFIFADKPINRFNILETNNGTLQINKEELLRNINSPLMLIGESPGAEEEKLGVPFRGEVGELLNKMLIAINIKRQNIYTSYAINFRPPDDRKPTSTEIKRYSVFLKEHISIINPKIIVLMGSSAMEAVTGISEKITNERGHWKEVILKNKTFPLMITFNPSYLIRFPENKKHSWEDLKKIRDKIKDLNLKF
jgi:uracil-DNA glycosylase family 4